MLIRATFSEFKGRVALGIVQLGTPAGKKLKKEKFLNWDDGPKLPMLLHVTNMDTLVGETVSLQSQSKTVLSLLLSRIVAQVRCSGARC